MGGVRLDSKLVAAGFDKNRNGIVSDELKIDAPIDSSGDGQVSVDELAAAISKDQVVISAGAVQARQPEGPADIPAIRIMKSVHKIAGESLTLFGALTPPWRYEVTKVRSDGTTYRDYNWAAACTELRAKLEAVKAVTRNMPDSRSQAIYKSASHAISAYNFGEVLDFFFEGKKGASDYASLHSTLSSIHKMSRTPAEPVNTVDTMAKSVNAAGGAVAGLRQNVENPAARGVESRVSAKASELRQKAQSIPWWQFLLLFGFFKKSSLNNQAKRLEENLATLKAANPDAAAGKAAELARQAYDVSTSAASLKTIDDAQKLENDAKPVVTGAETLRRDAEGQSRRIQELLKTVPAQ